MLTTAFTTADLPAAFRLHPDGTDAARAARTHGLHLDPAACAHTPARADCPPCLDARIRLAARELDATLT